MDPARVRGPHTGSPPPSPLTTLMDPRGRVGEREDGRRAQRFSSLFFSEQIDFIDSNGRRAQAPLKQEHVLIMLFCCLCVGGLFRILMVVYLRVVLCVISIDDSLLLAF